MEDATQRHLVSLGKGLVQVNLRLNRLTELLESRTAEPAGAPSTEPLLDLLEAVERTLDTALPVRSVPAPRSWWHRLFAPPPPELTGPDLTGLALARDRAREQLAQAGIHPAPTEGPADPRLHQVIETIPTNDPSLIGRIARTHQQGWYAAGDPPAVLRLAHVTAWRNEDPTS